MEYFGNLIQGIQAGNKESRVQEEHDMLQQMRSMDLYEKAAQIERNKRKQQVREQLAPQIDYTSPDSLLQGAQAFSQAGNFEDATSLFSKAIDYQRTLGAKKPQDAWGVPRWENGLLLQTNSLTGETKRIATDPKLKGDRSYKIETPNKVVAKDYDKVDAALKANSAMKSTFDMVDGMGSEAQEKFKHAVMSRAYQTMKIAKANGQSINESDAIDMAITEAAPYIQENPDKGSMMNPFNWFQDEYELNLPVKYGRVEGKQTTTEGGVFIENGMECKIVNGRKLCRKIK